LLFKIRSELKLELNRMS